MYIDILIVDLVIVCINYHLLLRIGLVVLAMVIKLVLLVRINRHHLALMSRFRILIGRRLRDIIRFRLVLEEIRLSLGLFLGKRRAKREILVPMLIGSKLRSFTALKEAEWQPNCLRRSISSSRKERQVQAPIKWM